MPRELLLSVHLEVALTVVDHDLVVHRLASEVLHVWVHSGSRHRVHIWLADVLCNDRDSKLPHVHLFVVSSGDKSASIFNKRDRVDGPQMLLILLDDLFRIRVELEDLLVRATCQENVLFVLCGVELDTEGCAPVCEASDDFSSLSVPKVDQFVEACAQVASAIVSEANVSHCFRVALVRSDAFAVCGSVPDLACSIMTCR